MDTKTLAKYEARAAIIKAMSHPNRLFIVDQLSKEERSVNELTEMVGETFPPSPSIWRYYEMPVSSAMSVAARRFSIISRSPAY